jgi:hypothetical protein
MTRVFARLHTLATTPEQYDVGLELVRDELLPWARESSGYCGLAGSSTVRQQALESFEVSLFDVPRRPA